MARTAVINPRRRRKKKSGGKRRRRNYGAAVAQQANRRRRKGGRRRRNPSVPAVYSSGGYRRAPNPFDLTGAKGLLSQVTETMPAATGGVWAARWAVKMAGPFENNEPGIKHALAIWLASALGAQVLSSVFRSPAKGEYARIAALGFGGDLFMRKRFMAGNRWVGENLYLDGVDDMDSTPDYSEGQDINGFQQQSALGDTFTDATGNTYVRTAQGWALAGMGETFVDEAGNVFTVDGVGADEYMGTPQMVYPSNYNQLMEQSAVGLPMDPAYAVRGSAVAGFQQRSALGLGRARSADSSFGYSPG